MAAEPDDERRTLKVHRSWSRTALDMMKFSWEKGELGVIPLCTGILLLVLASPVDGNLWDIESAPFRFDGIPLLTGPFPVLLIATSLLLCAGFFHRLFSRKTPQDRFFHPLLLGLRFLLSAMPVLGLLVFPLGSILISRSTARKASRDLATPRIALERSDGGYPRLRTGTSGGWIQSKGMVILFLISHSFSGVLLNQWTSEIKPTDRSHLFLLVALSSVFHLLAFSCGLLHVFLEVQKRYVPWSKLWRPVFVLSAWLIPYPFLPLLSLLPLKWSMNFDSAGGTLTAPSFLKRTAQNRLPLWRSLETSLKTIWSRLPGWRHWARPEARLIEPADSQGATSRLLWLYDLKVTFLVSDAAALTWLLLSGLDRDPLQRLLANGCVGTILLGSLLLGFIGILLNCVRWHRRYLMPSGHRSGLNQHPYGYVSTTSMALFFGLIFGTGIHRAPLENVKDLLLALAMLCSIFYALATLSTFVPSLKGIASASMEAQIRRGILTALALGIPGSFASMASVGFGGWMTGLWLCFSLLSGGVLSLLFLPWLLRPYRLGQILSDKAPVRIQAAALFMLITVLLPGGGWAVPIWITARHRLWPKA